MQVPTNVRIYKGYNETCTTFKSHLDNFYYKALICTRSSNKLTFWENEDGQFGFIFYMVTQSVVQETRSLLQNISKDTTFINNSFYTLLSKNVPWKNLKNRQKSQAVILPFGHKMSVFYFGAFKPNVWTSFDHGSLNDPHQAAMDLPDLSTQTQR